MRPMTIERLNKREAASENLRGPQHARPFSCSRSHRAHLSLNGSLALKPRRWCDELESQFPHLSCSCMVGSDFALGFSQLVSCWHLSPK